MPPRVWRWLLGRALPRELRDDVAADMDEMYWRRAQGLGVGRARMWYRAQVLSFALRFLGERVRRDGTGAPAGDRRRTMRFGVSWLDWKLGARMLVKFPGLSIIGGLALAAAIGLAAGVFEFVRQELHPDLPLDEGDRIVRIANWDAEAAREEPRSLHDFLEWRDQVRTVEQLGAFRTLERNLITEDGRAQPVRLAEISPSAFEVARVPPLLGRPLTEADARAGAPDVAVLGYDVWMRRFDGDRSILGRTVRLGHATAMVVGVMPEGFAFPRAQQLWVPLRASYVPPREGPPIDVFGRLADDASLESAQAELRAVGQRMAAASPETHARLRPRVLPFGLDIPGPDQRALVIMFYVGTLAIVAAAAANVATLVFARTAMRESEIVVRNALGATRGRIMLQLFTEALVLAGAAAALGLVGAQLALRFVWHQAVTVRQVPQPFWWDATLEPETVLYTAALAIAGAVLVGLLPAIKATGPRVQRGLARMASGGADMRFGGVWSVIIVMQVAFTVLCLPVGIGVTRETLRDHEMRAAFPSEEYLTFRAALDRETPLGATAVADDDALRERFAGIFDELERRLLAEPGVTDVTFADGLPGMNHPLRRIEAQRGTEPPFAVDANVEGRVRVPAVDVDFFRAFRVRVVAGRDFASGDAGGGVVVINEALAGNLGGSALGVHLRYAASDDGEQPGPWLRVIGVVRNLGMDPTERGESDFMFMPVAPADADPLLVAVRVGGDAAALAPRVSELAMRIDRGLRLYDVLTLDEVVRRRDLPNIIASFAATGMVLLAIMLSAAGLFALMSVAVRRRTREIGIRLALGASTRGILAAVFARAAAQLGIGIVVGNILIILLLSRLAENVRPELGRPLLGVSALMALVGGVACLVPARRALRVQPTEALKQTG